MYGHADMQESGLYFALLHLRRLFSLSVDETVSYLEDQVKNWALTLEFADITSPDRPHRWWSDRIRIDPKELKGVRKNWENVREHFMGAAKNIRTQIEQKEAVIQSLLSGVRVEAYLPIHSTNVFQSSEQSKRRTVSNTEVCSSSTR